MKQGLSEDQLNIFLKRITDNKTKCPSISAIQLLLDVIKHSESETLVQLREELKDSVDQLISLGFDVPCLISLSDIFLRFITLCSLEQPNFVQCKSILIKRGGTFLSKIVKCPDKIRPLLHPFIRESKVILSHSFSQSVFEALALSRNLGADFRLFVTQSSPDDSGVLMTKKLSEAGISSTLIIDAAVAYVMEQVDVVVLGCQGVVGNGGIINKIGTYTICLAASAHNKPVYVLAESFKFTRMLPLNQQDIPKNFKYPPTILNDDEEKIAKQHPLIDYTPPSFITLLFTDLGVLPPSAVSDELLKLYL